jgi:hypothetical protein
MRRFATGWARFAAVALALGCSACGGGGGCGAGALVDTAGWQVVDAGPFVFKVPPGYRQERVQGVDSYVGRWTEGERAAGFAYGQYTRDPRLRRGQDNAGRICTAHFGGREVAVEETEWKDARGQAHYAILGWWRLGPEQNDTLGQPHLRLHASAPATDREGQARARGIVRSVRIRTAWTEQDRLRERHRQCRDLRDHLAGRPPGAGEEQVLRRCPSGPPPPPADYESVR